MGLTAADYIHTPYGTRQRELSIRVSYDRAYLEDRYANIPEKLVALAEMRVRVLSAFVPRGRLLDFGCGLGATVQAARRAGWDALGYDLVAPPASVPSVPVDELTAHRWDVVTFFDSLEHLPQPDAAIRTLNPKWVCVSVPWCHFPDRWAWFDGYIHRREYEHLYHWNRETLIEFFRRLGYRCLMTSCFEDAIRRPREVGVENILSGIFERES